MEADGDSPQLWSPPTTLLIPVHRRRRRTSPILNRVALILAIPILLLLIIFLILPPFLSHASSVQKGWDSINIFLVLFAVLCGVFARRNDDNPCSDNADEQKNLDAVTNVSEDNIRKSVASSKWLDFPDKEEYDKMRSSRSYPDLRQESLWGSENNGSKFFDDFEVNFHRQPEKLYHRERRSQKVEMEAVAEPAPPPPPVKRRQSVHRSRNDEEKNENRAPPPPAPSLPPEPEFHSLAEKGGRIQREKSGAMKEITTAIASLHYGTQTQRKKQVKTRDIYESATEDSLPPSSLAPPSTPPPPPPPPPSKGFQSLLKKSSKSKRVHSVPTTAHPPPPPPPPPPPNSFFANIFKTGSKSKRFQLSSASSQPPPPPPPPPYSIFNNIFSSGSKSNRFQISSASPHPPPPHPSPPTSSILNSSFENITKSRRFKNPDTLTPPLPPPETRPVYTGKPPKPPKPSTSSHNKTDIIVPPSLLIPMPAPPPPPPFRMPETKFVPNGDLAMKRSTNSSPELEDVDVMSIDSDGGHLIRPPVSCPSPDVNTKADTFISRLRDGWRLEKLNSINERQNSVSTTSNRPGS